MMECSFADGVLIHRVLVEFVNKECELAELMMKLRQMIRENQTGHSMLIELWEYHEPSK
jgi:hypothetical protein